MTTYVRTNGGATVHLATCRYSVNGVPWLWAGDRSREEILAELQSHGVGLKYDWCKRCFPRSGGGKAPSSGMTQSASTGEGKSPATHQSGGVSGAVKRGRGRVLPPTPAPAANHRNEI